VHRFDWLKCHLDICLWVKLQEQYVFKQEQILCNSLRVEVEICPVELGGFPRQCSRLVSEGT
jgi:hypothetical protein